MYNDIIDVKEIDEMFNLKEIGKLALWGEDEAPESILTINQGFEHFNEITFSADNKEMCSFGINKKGEFYIKAHAPFEESTKKTAEVWWEAFSHNLKHIYKEWLKSEYSNKTDI